MTNQQPASPQWPHIRNDWPHLQEDYVQNRPKDPSPIWPQRPIPDAIQQDTVETHPNKKPHKEYSEEEYGDADDQQETDEEIKTTQAPKKVNFIKLVPKFS